MSSNQGTSSSQSHKTSEGQSSRPTVNLPKPAGQTSDNGQPKSKRQLKRDRAAEEKKKEQSEQIASDLAKVNLDKPDSSATAGGEPSAAREATQPMGEVELDPEDIIDWDDEDEIVEDRPEDEGDDDEDEEEEQEIITEKDETMATEVVPSKIRPLETGEFIEKELPKNLRQQDAWMYPNKNIETDIVYGGLRGRDEPHPDTLKSGSNSALKSDVVLTFRNDSKIIFSAGALKSIKSKDDENSKEDGSSAAAQTKKKPTRAKASAPQPQADKPEETASVYRPVRLHWITHSQIPGFYLSVTRRPHSPDDKEGQNEPVTVHFHVNNVACKKDKEDSDFRACISHTLGNEARLTGRLDPKAGLVAESNTSSVALWSTDVAVWRTGGDQPNPSLPKAEPIFRNISEDDLARIREVGESNFAGNLEVMPQGDWILYGLMRCTSFTMYRSWNKDDRGKQVFDSFTSYMTALMNDVAVMGNFPFYQRQASAAFTNIDSEDFKFESAAPPRHMVTSWRVTYEAHKPVKAVAETWSYFPPLIAYPEVRAKVIAMRLGIARSRPNELAAVQEAIDKHMGRVQCDFMKLSQVGAYYGEIFISDSAGKIFAEGSVNPPAPNTRVTMEVTTGEYQGKKFQGVVIPDAYGRGRDICVSVFVKKGHTEFPFASTNVDVSIEFADDATPCDRQEAAMIQLGRGTQRIEGVDFSNTLMECPRTIEATDSLSREVKGSSRSLQVWQSVMSNFNLTPEQDQALDMSYDSNSGLTVVHGPPGTGKTYCQMVGMVGHLAVGNLPDNKRRPAIATAPSQTAVDHNMGTFLAIAKKAGHKFQVCRLRGGAMSPYMGKTRSDNEGIKQALFSLNRGAEPLDGDDAPPDYDAYAIWESIDASTKDNKRLGAGVMPEYEFPAQRKAFISRHAKDKGSAWVEDARNYLQLKWEVVKAKGEEKKKLRENLDQWDAVWNQRYFDQVDIVFSTNNGAAHPLLTLHFKPRIAGSDEVGQANLPDQATPLAANIDTLEYFWATGDPMQQGPMPLAKGSNESIADVSKSPFQLLFSNKSVRERVMMVEQHRMRPVISRMVSKIWYHDMLRNGKSVLTPAPLEQTILDAYARLKPFWNGSTRMMVDVSGPSVKSETYGDQTSLYNKAEADVILDQIEFFIRFRPEDPALPLIQHEDILVITAYSGQTMYIIQQLWKRNINKPGQGEVRVKQVRAMTSGSVQGGEAPIVLHSMVRNEPGKPLAMGFTRKTNQLCVNFSRAQIHHISFGNVKALMQAKINEVKKLQKGGILNTWGRIVQDFYDAGELMSGEHLVALQKDRPIHIDDSIMGKFEASSAKTGFGQPRPGGRGRGRGRGDGPRHGPDWRQPFVMKDAPALEHSTNAMRDMIEARRKVGGAKRAHEAHDQRTAYEPPQKRSKDGEDKTPDGNLEEMQDAPPPEDK